MIDTTELCLIPVWMTMTFIQGHSCMRNQKLVHSFLCKFLAWFWLNLTYCHNLFVEECVEAYANFLFFCTINIQGKELCFRHIIKYTCNPGCVRTIINLLDTMHHFCGFAGLPRCAIFVALHMSHCELCKCKWESFMTNQNICCDFALASSVLANAESYFWIDFLQGESVAESGSVISHYFRTYFSLYVVPRGLIDLGKFGMMLGTTRLQFVSSSTFPS